LSQFEAINLVLAQFLGEMERDISVKTKGTKLLTQMADARDERVA